jgi:HEAT repeat protein
VTDDPVQKAIAQLLAPYGGEGHARDRDRATAVLLEHSEQANAAVLALLESRPPGAHVTPLVAVLPLLGRPESVPLLARLLREGSEPLALSAAAALARHPSPEAHAALDAALADPREDVARAAAYGLEERGG